MPSTSKRPKAGRSHHSDSDGDMEMTEQSAWSGPIRRAEFVYDMDSKQDRGRLLREMWRGEYAHAVGAQSACNPELASVLGLATANTYKDRDRGSEGHAFGQQMTMEGVMSDLVRWQSQKQIPLWTALTSVDALRFQVVEENWCWFRCMHPGVLATITWTKKLVSEAPKFDPGCPYDCIPGVSCAVFDNYTRKCKYKALATEGTGGYRLDMTNWGTFGIPRTLEPLGFDAAALCAPPPTRPCPPAGLTLPICCAARSSPFRTNLSITAFTSSFLMTNREIRQNKEARFSACLRQAAIGTLFERPHYCAPWKPHIRFHKPMYGVLQSSHDDVKYELNKMQRHAAGSKYVIIGGDGLSLMRIDQLLGKHPDVYIDNDRLPMVRLGLVLG